MLEYVLVLDNERRIFVSNTIREGENADNCRLLPVIFREERIFWVHEQKRKKIIDFLG